jgi:hypothetical protein
MHKAIIFAVVLIILCGSITYGQDDSIPKIVESDSSYLPEVEADSIDDGYFLDVDTNPFCPSGIFRFGVSDTSDVIIVIYDIEGRRIRTLLDTLMAPGSDKVIWDACDDDGNVVESGIYFIKMEARNQKVHFEETKRIYLC